MARSIGLLTPEYFPARVFINNETNGLHYFLSEIDESFLRKNNRMPGSIYSGDSLYIVNPYIDNIRKGETAFKDKDDIPLLWKDFRLWKKDASRNAESLASQEEIKMFIRTIHEADPLIFSQTFDTYFDKQKFYLFWALDRLVGSFHHDLFHNHRIYFDPYKGKFEPIEWDLRFWEKDAVIPVTPLHKRILLNPLLKYEADSVSYDLLKKFTIDLVIDMIDDANNTITRELAADPYRIQPDIDLPYFGIDKVVPFSMNKYAEAIEYLKHTFIKRHKFIEHEINLSFGNYLIERQSENQFEITIAIDGNSPIEFDPWSIVPESLHEDIEMFRVYKDNTFPVFNNGELDRLYPGVATSKNSDKIALYGLELYHPSPQYYRYLIKGANRSDLIKSNELTGRNSISSNRVIIEHVENLPDNDKTQSLHPWRLLSQQKSIKNEIVLSGEINITQDLVFTGEQKVTILPNTIFKLSRIVLFSFTEKLLQKERLTNQ